MVIVIMILLCMCDIMHSVPVPWSTYRFDNLLFRGFYLYGWGNANLRPRMLPDVPSYSVSVVLRCPPNVTVHTAVLP